jgi:hypothetical protein
VADERQTEHDAASRSEIDPRDYDYARLRRDAMKSSCPNGPDPETGEYPCDPKGYFGVAECQTCGWIGAWPK